MRKINELSNARGVAGFAGSRMKAGASIARQSDKTDRAPENVGWLMRKWRQIAGLSLDQHSWAKPNAG